MILVNVMNKKTENKQIQKNKQNVEVALRSYALLSLEELFAQLSSKQTGLTTAEVEEKQVELGKNIITTTKKSTPLHRLVESVINPFNIILLLIAGITYFTDVVTSTKPDYLTVIIILSLVFLSSLVAFIQSERSNAAAEKLSKMISNKADVWRDEKLVDVLLEELVPGDVIKLSAGDMLPADIRFLTTKDTFIAQSALTGESNPVEKFSKKQINSDEGLTDLSNLGFMGSNVISGSATAIILATGNNTYFGSMAKSLSGDRAKTSFERGVDLISKLLVRMMLVMVPVVFLINGVIKEDWLHALLFSISIAVEIGRAHV